MVTSVGLLWCGTSVDTLSVGRGGQRTEGVVPLSLMDRDGSAAVAAGRRRWWTCRRQASGLVENLAESVLAQAVSG